MNLQLVYGRRVALASGWYTFGIDFSFRVIPLIASEGSRRRADAASHVLGESFRRVPFLIAIRSFLNLRRLLTASASCRVLWRVRGTSLEVTRAINFRVARTVATQPETVPYTECAKSRSADWTSTRRQCKQVNGGIEYAMWPQDTEQFEHERSLLHVFACSRA